MARVYGDVGAGGPLALFALLGLAVVVGGPVADGGWAVAMVGLVAVLVVAAPWLAGAVIYGP